MIIYGKKHPLENLGKLPDQEIRKVGNGINGNLDTIEVMKKMAREYSRHDLVKRLSTNILHYNNIPSHHYLDEARAIGEFVKKHVRYVKDPVGTESLQAPDMMIRMMKDAGYTMGDCDDMALLTAAMLMSVGIRPRFRAVRYRGDENGNFNHIYVVVYEKNVSNSDNPGPTKRLVLDCIIKDKPIGFEIKHASGKEFPV
jgi:hypothetical protein